MGCQQSQIKPAQSQNFNQTPQSKEGPLRDNLKRLSFANSFSRILRKIEIQIKQDVYMQRLEVNYLKQIIVEAEYSFLTVQQRHSMLEVVLDYMAFCKNQAKVQQPLKTKLNGTNFISKMGEAWLKLKNQIYFTNNDTLKILSLLQPTSKSTPFSTLKFNFDRDEMLGLSKSVKEFCSYDLRAFCFLSNYLYNSCLELEKQGKSIEQIQRELLGGLQSISKEHPPAPPLSGDEQLFLKHKSFKKQLQESQKVYLDLSYCQDNEREKKLIQFIGERAIQANSHYKTFVDLIKDICTKDGYHFKSGLKLKTIEDKRSLQRIKEKILNTSFQKFKPQDIANKAKTLSEYIIAQETAYKKSMEEMYQNLNGKLQFKVSDLLRAKCVFSSIDKINECCVQLKKNVEQSGHLLVEVDNRLKGKTGTSDIVLKILIGRTICELQLVIDLNVASYEFSHKIYEITRSKFYTPLTMLKVINEQLSIPYFQELNKVIEINAGSQRKNKYQEAFSYKQVQGKYQQFKKLLPVDVKQSDFILSQQLIDEYFERFQTISKAIVIQSEHSTVDTTTIHKSNAEFKIILKEYEEALKQSNIYKQQMEVKYGFLLEKEIKVELTEEQKKVYINYANGIRNIGRIFQNKGLNDKAIESYQQSIETLLSVKTPQSSTLISKMQFNIAWLEYKKCNYEKALLGYQQILINQEKIIGKDNMEYASTLNNIGLVYFGQGKYPESLKVYEQSLIIRQKLVGKQSMECTSTLNNIGLVYNSMGKYTDAVKYFHRCLQIKEKVKGRESTECALTLNNIGMVYSNQGKLREALTQYLRSLQIREAVKGVDSIDCATTLCNIGLLYRRQGEFPIALNYINRSLNIRIRTNGENSIDCATNYSNIGQILLMKGNIKQSRDYFQKAKTIIMKVKGKESTSYANLLIEASIVDIEEDCFENAQRQLNAAIQIILKIKGKQSRNYSEGCKYLTRLFLRMKRWDEAQLQIKKSFAAYKDSNYQTLNCIELNVYQAQIELERQNFTEARKSFESAIRICNKNGYYYQFYSQARKGLGDIFLNQHSLSEALKEYEIAAPIMRRFYSNGCKSIEKSLQECRRLADRQGH